MPHPKAVYTIAMPLIIGLAVFLSACFNRPVPVQEGETAPQQIAAKTVGGGCEDCELIYTGIPKEIAATDTAPDWQEPGTKLLVSGTVLKPDGRTPAPDIVLYYYHTDATGRYTKRPGEQTRHGYIRGWIKTGADGRYVLHTNRPAPYPGRADPAHIHLLVKEPGLNEYWVDELVFEDDTLLTDAYRSRQENRGRSGILRVEARGGLQSAEHDIVLGKNIPDYPAAAP